MPSFTITMSNLHHSFSLPRFHWQRFTARLHRARVALHSRDLSAILRSRMNRTASTHAPPAVVSAGTSVPPSGGNNRILWVDTVPPRPDRDSGSVRAFNVMRLLREMGYTVEFRSERKVAKDDPAIALLATLGIHLHADSGRYPRRFLDEAACYAAVIVCRYQLAEYWLPLLQRAAPSIRTIFDTVDLHHLRESREAEVRGNRHLLKLAGSTRERELDCISRADITWVVSTAERDYLSAHMPAARVEIVSNLHEVAGEVPGFQQRQDLLFVGSAQHPPNVDAVHWIVDSLFPCIRAQLPGVRIHMVGAGLETAAGEKAGVEGIIWHGHVQDLDTLLSTCRAGIAPLRFGAGVKGKITQGMACGLPMITTSCGAEGMQLTSGHDILVADSDDAFSDAVARLHGEEVLWNAISRNGRENVARNFSATAARPAIEASLALPNASSRPRHS